MRIRTHTKNSHQFAYMKRNTKRDRERKRKKGMRNSTEEEKGRTTKYVRRRMKRESEKAK